MAKQFIISIGREYGSGGRVIAEHLAKTLNVKFYDKNIIEHIAQEKKLNLDQLKSMMKKLVIFGFQGLLTVLATHLRILLLRCNLIFLKKERRQGNPLWFWADVQATF